MFRTIIAEAIEALVLSTFILVGLSVVIFS
jgi:hypothetical protein